MSLLILFNGGSRRSITVPILPEAGSGGGPRSTRMEGRDILTRISKDDRDVIDIVETILASGVLK